MVMTVVVVVFVVATIVRCLAQAVVVTVTVISGGNLTRASCHRNMRLCKQEGLGSCAFIVSTRHMQVQLANVIS